MAQGPSPQEDSPMLHAVHYPRDLIADRVRFTPADQAQIAQCRGAHNRLGFAYQLGFLRLTGRFPAQQPLELLDDLLVFVAQEVALDPALIQDYAQRRQTVSEHQQLLALYLGFRPFGPAERDALGHFLRDEALRLESTPALVAQAEAFLRDHTHPRARQLDPPSRGRGTARPGPPAALCPAAGLPAIPDARGP